MAVVSCDRSGGWIEYLILDRWLNGQSLSRVVPHLFSVISGRTKKRTVFDGLTDMRWVSDIRGALTVPVLAEYLELWDLLTEVALQPNVADTHIWRFAASG
jgi:hypothetical protein